MIIGSVVLQLTACNKGTLPISHGRLAHAALLNIVREIDPELSEFMHDTQFNNFAVGLLRFSSKSEGQIYKIEKDTIAYWRIAAIGKRLLDILWNIPKGLSIRIGSVTFLVSMVFLANRKGENISKIDTEDLEEALVYLPPMKFLTFKFLAPTTFSVDNGYYPFPLPILIFSSLADKWNKFSDGVTFETKYIRDIARLIVPVKWEGKSCRYNIAQNRILNCFTGSYTYDVGMLPPEYQRILILLAEFAVYSGVGKYTGQGLGLVEIEYN